MAKKEQSDREIAQLLDELREQTATVTSDAKTVESKKTKKMTDDDVKAMLRRYYGDTDTLPQEKEPAFEFDISDFEDNREPVREEPVKQKSDKKKRTPAKKAVPEPDPETFFEPETIEPETVEPEPENIDEPEPEGVFEPESESIEEPEPFEATESEPSDDEAGLDEIIYDISDMDETESRFALEENVEPPAQFEEECAEITPEPEVSEPEPEAAEPEPEAAEPEPEAAEPEPEAAEPEPDNLTESEPDDAPIPVLPDEEDMREWKPSADVSGRPDDGELDLMVALGFGDKLVDKYGEERLRRAREKLMLNGEKSDVDNNAFGYSGSEYTQSSDASKIKDKFNHDFKKLIVRLIGTVVFALALMIFENLQLFGVAPKGLTANPTFSALLSFFLLVGCAMFSYRRLWEGLLFSIGRRKNGSAVMTLTVIVIAAFDIVVAIAAPEDGVALYNFPAALGLLFGVLSELMDFSRERLTFNLLSDGGAGELYGLCGQGIEERDRGTLTADRITFAEGYFRRTGSVRRSYPLLLLITVLPLAAAGALLSVSAAVSGIPAGRSLSAFPAVFAFAAPVSWLLCNAWQLLRMTHSITDKKSGIIGGVVTDDYITADCVVFDDNVAFPSSGVRIKNIKLYDNSEIYKTIYNVNALFAEAGGPLREIMRFTAANLGEPQSVVMTGAADHYIEALVDGENRVCAGSFAALSGRGIKIAKSDTASIDGSDACVMYAALNGEVCARFCVEYTVDPGFLEAAEKLASDGIGIRIRTLDPNLDRTLLFAQFGERIDAGIRREPHHAGSDNIPAVTSVFSRGDVCGLAEPLVRARRARRSERAMNTARVTQMAVGVAAAALLVFFNAPIYMLSAAAAAIQLVCVVPAAIIYSLGNRR